MSKTILIIGYGNPGRRDDGLGVALAQSLEEESWPGVRIETDYQLTLEDAHALCSCEVVIFVDASIQGAEPYNLAEIQPQTGLGYSSHSLKAEEVLGICLELFGRKPQAYLLSIRGYEFSPFMEGLSSQAKINLESAKQALLGLLRDLQTYDELSLASPA